MTKLIDISFTLFFMVLAIACTLIFLYTGCKRIDLAVYGVCSYMLSMILLNSYIKHLNLEK